MERQKKPKVTFRSDLGDRNKTKRPVKKLVRKLISPLNAKKLIC
jgi:hypothetical protein